MLWDIIRDFIVQNITGGHLSTGHSNILTGQFQYDTAIVNVGNMTTLQLQYQIGTDAEGHAVNMCLGDWLATTITIIAMCLIVVFAIWLVRWVFKAVTSAFLLRR